MIHKIRMPRVDANVQEATVGAWRTAVGQNVERGQALVEVITDKANFELEAEQEGILRRQVASEKSVVPVGYIIALVSESADEKLPDVANENEEIMTQYQQALITGDFDDLDVDAPVVKPQSAESPRRVRATPAARKLAGEHSIDLQAVAESSEGVVKVEDVEAYLENRS